MVGIRYVLKTSNHFKTLRIEILLNLPQNFKLHQFNQQFKTKGATVDPRVQICVFVTGYVAVGHWKGVNVFMQLGIRRSVILHFINLNQF